MDKRVTALIENGIREGVAPGMSCAISLPDGSTAFACRGNFTYDPRSASIGLSTLWDLASLTKVVGTTTVAMRLYDRGQLELDSPLASCVPRLGGLGRDRITIRNLLLHNSGLPASLPREALGDVWCGMARQELAYEPGSQTIYSDVGFIALGYVLEAISGTPLDRLVAEELGNALSLKETQFCPKPDLRARCAPTEVFDGIAIQGCVHDPTCAAMGGVAGHAGLFSTIQDLDAFARGMLRSEIASPNTIELFTTRASAASSRALGWDTPSEGSSAGSRFGPRSFGHTGFTGTSIWIDPDRQRSAILLTNRVHPTADNTKIKDFRIAFHDLVAAV